MINKYPEESIRIIDIKGFENFYGITEDGRGWRYGYKGYPGRWLTPILNCKCDMPVFTLHIRRIKKRSTIAISKIVAKAFIENPHNFSKIELIDGDIHNSHYKNLRWVPSGKECTIEGQIFESEHKAAKYYGIKKATFKNRRHLGWSVEEAVGVKKREYDFNNLSGFIYLITDKTNGKKYVGQTKTTLDKRLDAHFQASGKISNPNKNGILYAISCKSRENFKFSVLEEVENINDLNEREIFHISHLKTLSPNGYNLNSGGSGGKYQNKIFYDGYYYSSNNDIARCHGIDTVNFKTRLQRGLSIDQALGKASVIDGSIKKKRDIEYNGIKYKSVSKLSVSLGIPRTTIAARLGRGMSIKDAIEYKSILPNKLPDPIKITIQGITYKSKGEAARSHGIKPSIFIKRLKEGWDLESAIGIKQRVQWHK